MIDWNRSGRYTVFRYVRVKWPSYVEAETIEGVTGCRLEESLFTALKVAGQLDCVNIPDLGDDMIRIYSDSTVGEASETVCHGTLFAACTQSDATNALREGPVQLYSTLLAMRQRKSEQTYTAPYGANAVNEIVSLVERCGLRAIATPSLTTLKANHSWDPGTEYLDIANEIADMIGYGSMAPDAYGNVVVSPYADPAAKAAAVTISDTWDSVGAPTLFHKVDDYETPNVVVLTYSNANGEPMSAVASNDDPSNRYSTAARSKRIVRYEELSEIEGRTALEAKAKFLLAEGMTAIESVEIHHSWLPFALGDAASIDYRRAGLTAKMSAATRTVEMTADISCTTRFRRSVPLG